MQLIPVIDLKGGLVVRAFRGQRDAYRPIITPLSPSSSAPADVVAAFLGLYPFPTIYIADLDAIESRGDNRDAIIGLMQSFPKLRFWLDAGFRSDVELNDWAAAPQIDPVIGSESLACARLLRRLAENTRAVLSLDFHGDMFLGPIDLLETPSKWPQRVIVMTLARVGAGEGPDLQTLMAVKARAEGRKIFAAGGVRGAQDVALLQSAGVSGVLIASALHNGGLSIKELERLADK